MSNLPQHIGIVMDGNRRWAKRRGLNPFAGHKLVVEETSEKLIDHAGKLGIPYLTLWAWSSENWNRPGKEVSGIMKLFRWSLENRADKFIRKGARLNVIGDISKFPKDIQHGIEAMMEKSKKNNKITVTFALNYGGRDEIVRAVNLVVGSRESGVRSPSQIAGRQDDSDENIISEQEISRNLDTKDIPDPDLIIRPGGQKRLSGFLTWQSVYSELYFTDVLMPDFGPEELDKAIEDYQKRKRTFGGGGFGEVVE